MPINASLHSLSFSAWCALLKFMQLLRLARADVVGHPIRVLLLLQALVEGCLERAELSSEGVKYVALHGTGTPLGDPIEVGALSAALQPLSGTSAPHVVAFGSNKASTMLSTLNTEVNG